jgi:ubiquinone/menaquinone biosynthesis C-methylase UbiE
MTYVLQTNLDAQQRLRIQHELYEKSSQQFLLQSGLIPGMRVLEIGCGPGLMTPWLAQSVTQSGHVTAIDSDGGYIELTQESCKEFPQVMTLKKNLYELSADSSYDLIYCRLVLHHLSDPEAAIKIMLNALKHKGILVCEEVPANEGIFAYPHSPALEKLVTLVTKCFKANGADYNIAYRLASLFKTYKLAHIQQQLFQPLATVSKYRLLHGMGLQELGVKMLEFGILTREELNALDAKLKVELEAADSVSLYKMFQVSGMKVG